MRRTDERDLHYRRLSSLVLGFACIKTGPLSHKIIDNLMRLRLSSFGGGEMNIHLEMGTELGNPRRGPAVGNRFLIWRGGQRKPYLGFKRTSPQVKKRRFYREERVHWGSRFSSPQSFSGLEIFWAQRDS